MGKCSNISCYRGWEPEWCDSGYVVCLECNPTGKMPFEYEIEKMKDKRIKRETEEKERKELKRLQKKYGGK